MLTFSGDGNFAFSTPCLVDAGSKKETKIQVLQGCKPNIEQLAKAIHEAYFSHLESSRELELTCQLTYGKNTYNFKVTWHEEFDGYLQEIAEQLPSL